MLPFALTFRTAPTSLRLCGGAGGAAPCSSLQEINTLRVSQEGTRLCRVSPERNHLSGLGPIGAEGYSSRMTAPKSYVLHAPEAWKSAMHRHLRDQGISRYEFVRRCVDNKVCTLHTAECLLADEGTVTGQRKPSFELAVEMARLAGFDLVLIPRPSSRKATK